jgi:hypothetical protein
LFLISSLFIAKNKSIFGEDKSEINSIRTGEFYYLYDSILSYPVFLKDENVILSLRDIFEIYISSETNNEYHNLIFNEKDNIKSSLKGSSFKYWRISLSKIKGDEKILLFNIFSDFEERNCGKNKGDLIYNYNLESGEVSMCAGGKNE